MDPLLLIASVIVAWLLIAAAVAFALGRAAAAGEHEHQLGALRREAESAGATATPAETSPFSTLPRS